jgi:hypothetical protein
MDLASAQRSKLQKLVRYVTGQRLRRNAHLTHVQIVGSRDRDQQPGDARDRGDDVRDGERQAPARRDDADVDEHVGCREIGEYTTTARA